MTTQTITSATSGNEYKLYIYEGQARGCTCPARQHNHFKACKHMNEYNSQVFDAEVQRATTFAALFAKYDCRANGDEVTRRCYYELQIGA